MASRKKTKAKAKPLATVEATSALADQCFAHLADANDAIKHMKTEMSPGARVSWRERATLHISMANSLMNLIRTMRGQ